MPLSKLVFRPGINRETTAYANEGGWWDGNLVRFRAGKPESIGGWTKYSLEQSLGTGRSLMTWTALDGTVYTGMGTNLKYYAIRGGGLNDITPLRETTVAGAVTFAATNGSAVITVSDTNHGALPNDFVTFSGAASLGGVITGTILNAEHQITSVINANSYTITVSVAANASDVGNGGASVIGAYQINTGLNGSVGGLAFGRATAGALGLRRHFRGRSCASGRRTTTVRTSSSALRTVAFSIGMKALAWLHAPSPYQACPGHRPPQRWQRPCLSQKETVMSLLLAATLKALPVFKTPLSSGSLTKRTQRSGGLWLPTRRESCGLVQGPRSSQPFKRSSRSLFLPRRQSTQCSISDLRLLSALERCPRLSHS